MADTPLKIVYITPAIYSAGGVERVIELELDEEDSIRFYESEKVVKQNVELLKAMMAQL